MKTLLRLSLLTVLIVFSSASCFATVKDSHQNHGIQSGISASQNLLLARAAATRINVTAGYRFNEHHYLGIGSGYSLYSSHSDGSSSSPSTLHGIPIYVDYSYYFPSKQHMRRSFFIGAETGMTYYMNESDLYRYQLHLSPKLGWDWSFPDRGGFFVGINYLYSYDEAGLGFSLGFRF